MTADRRNSLPAEPRLRAHARAKSLIADHYRRVGAQAEAGAPVAWCSSMGPTELLRALGFEVFYPEHRAAAIGAMRRADPAIIAAASAGFASDVCSYLTADIGWSMLGQDPLAQRLGLPSAPPPDLLVTATHQCKEVSAWLDYYAEQYSAPLVRLNFPTGLHEISGEHVAAAARELRRVLPELEAAAGAELRPEAFARVTDTAARAAAAWERCLELARARPAPWTFWDQLTLMGPIVILRGLEQCAEFYEELERELQERLTARVRVPAGETWRLYWEGMPMWGKLAEHAALCARNGAAVTASTYCNSWRFTALDPAESWTSCARAYLSLFINRSESYKLGYLAEHLESYAIDAVVFHLARTCPANTNTRYALPRRLRERTGRPYIIVYGDMNDLRCHNEPAFVTALEALREQVCEGL